MTQVAVLYCNLGSVSVVHISEEVNDASLVVPQVIWWSYLLNLAMGIVMLITMLFCIGPLDSAVNAEVPYLAHFANTGSNALATVVCILLLLLIFAGNVTCLAATSREIWAFSRDHGFSCSKWISAMNDKHQIPFNSVYLTTILTGVLCLINIGSFVAFNIIITRYPSSHSYPPTQSP